MVSNNKEGKTFEEARKTCQTNLTSLFYLKNDQEYSYYQSLIKFIREKSNVSTEYFMGLNYSKSNEQWVWHTGTQLSHFLSQKFPLTTPKTDSLALMYIKKQGKADFTYLDDFDYPKKYICRFGNSKIIQKRLCSLTNKIIILNIRFR
jgi:hypothetical protein